MTKGGKNKDKKGKKQMSDGHPESKRKRFPSTSQSETMVSTRSKMAKSQQDNPSISKNQKRTRSEEVSEEEGEISEKERNRVPEGSYKEDIVFARDDHDKDDGSHHQQKKLSGLTAAIPSSARSPSGSFKSIQKGYSS